MGYTKYVFSGDFVEIYEYEKYHVPTNQRHTRRKTRKKTAFYNENLGIPFRNKRSIQRARKAFFRLVQANLKTTERPCFFTLTVEQECDVLVAYKALRDFIGRLRKKHGPKVRYISVPEWQSKSGFIHFHCLIWGIPEINKEWERAERDRRNYQRQWLRGYCDVRVAENTSPRIAGYMAKYMFKAASDTRLRNIRAYSSGGPLQRPWQKGTNSGSDVLAVMIPVDNEVVSVGEYDTLWLGKCHYKQIKISTSV